MNTLLPKSFCSLEHFASQLTLLLNTVYSLTLFTPQHTLLLGSTTSRNTLLPGTLYSLEHFTPWNTLSYVFQRAKGSKKQSVPGSKEC